MKNRTYRIFTNDRGIKNGVALYSALKDVEATSATAAVKKCPAEFHQPPLHQAVALEWPEARDSAWIRKHVDVDTPRRPSGR